MQKNYIFDEKLVGTYLGDECVFYVCQLNAFHVH